VNRTEEIPLLTKAPTFSSLPEGDLRRLAELSKSFKKPRRKLIKEMLHGIQASNNVKHSVGQCNEEVTSQSFDKIPWDSCLSPRGKKADRLDKSKGGL